MGRGAAEKVKAAEQMGIAKMIMGTTVVIAVGVLNDLTKHPSAE
jgi:hypothetical protein